ncbi:MAG: A/G-specific adenine glycosylase [Pseudorhodoplanes sp.]|uniref:A/G-specific adenine glycosylase n=1 Tax=Pseudorhodoplanes sp. TaxID=1934341 RepID=UPI003D0F679D
MTLANRRSRKKRDESGDCAPPAVAPAAALLAWYDRHRRRLPWRAESGERSDPYRVWLSEIMLQQTNVKTAGPYYERFLRRWPTIAELAADRLEEVLKLWAGLGYYARARNLHACARAVVHDHGGRFPQTEADLLALPGIGAYTAAAIAAIAFDRKATPVDGNIERVVARLHAVEEPLPRSKPKIRALAAALTPDRRAGDFAQAMMDLGATICTPKRPACALCPWHAPCIARKRADIESFPRKAPKAEGKLRRGAAFVVTRADGALLVRTRPDKGLLAKMTEVPTTEWTHHFDEADVLTTAPLAAQWHRVAGLVTHTFTHFPLELAVYRTRVGNHTQVPDGMRWIAAAEIEGEAFPNVMRKVIAHSERG